MLSSLTLPLPSLSSSPTLRKLAIKCIKRWMKKAKTSSTRNRLMKINSYVKGNTKSKNRSRRINTLGVARRRVFLRRWYYYANSHTEKRLYMKKVSILLFIMPIIILILILILRLISFSYKMHNAPRYNVYFNALLMRLVLGLVLKLIASTSMLCS